jgi:hypothetical protein
MIFKNIQENVIFFLLKCILQILNNNFLSNYQLIQQEFNIKIETELQ